jgi:hypothetical protein
MKLWCGLLILCVLITGCATSSDGTKGTTESPTTPAVIGTSHMLVGSDTPAPARVVTTSTKPVIITISGAAAAACDCSGDKYNCKDFKSHVDAQVCYEYCISQGKGDVHRLDADSDKVACKGLP